MRVTDNYHSSDRAINMGAICFGFMQTFVSENSIKAPTL